MSKIHMRLLSALLLAMVLSACGMKGPLYMPAPPPPDAGLSQPPAVPDADDIDPTNLPIP